MVEQRDRYRTARLLLLDTDGTTLGLAPPVHLDEPWLQEIRPLREHAARKWGLDMAVLRLLTVDDTPPVEIRVTYLAQLLSAPERIPPFNFTADTTPDGLLQPAAFRLPYAEAGGPAADLDWAAEQLRVAGFGEIQQAMQQRTWNLSAIWRLQCPSATFWLKHVPPFFGHESAALALFATEPVPGLLAADGCRLLLHDVPGSDAYDATLAQKITMVERLVDLQYRWHDRVDELLGAGLPDVRGQRLVAFIDEALSRSLPGLSTEDRKVLADFRATLPERLTALDNCGLPATLVHGDFHPGNWRGAGNDLTMLDWGDCFIGHPLMDVPALIDRTPASDRPLLLAHWSGCWRARIPSADVEQALALSNALSTARFAATFQMFLDNIEPSEHVYHETDPVLWFHRTAEILRRENPSMTGA